MGHVMQRTPVLQASSWTHRNRDIGVSGFERSVDAMTNSTIVQQFFDSYTRALLGRDSKAIAEHYGAPAPHVTGQFRDGDVRAAWADTARARQALDWEPLVGVTEGINRLCDWIDAQEDASAETATAMSTDTATEV